MKKTCTMYLLVWIAGAAAVYSFARDRMPERNVLIGSSIAGGFFLAMGLGYWWGILALVGARRSIRRGVTGEGFDDGARVAAIGTAAAQGPLLTSPFQQKPCVAYSYEIKSEGEVKYADGFAMTPCTIQTQSGAVRILAWPELAWPADYPFGEETKRRAGEYVDATQFTKFSGFREALRTLRELRADSDGTMRFDHQMSEWNPLMSATFAERVLAPGDQVCALGRYSAMQQGFVPDESEAVQSIKITKGGAEQALRSSSSPITYFILGLICNGIVVGGLILLHRLR
ncbi:MAG TPA: hypothetical protein VN181_03060 [Thermoanaerobaculia bacterium]|nr:hypothetical protein [Thermoanaerobaculia bacterium]